MADGAKYHLVSSASDLKQTAASHLLVSPFPFKSKLFFYLFLFLFVSFTLFLAFSPSSSSSSSSDSLFGSFSSIFSHFFLNSTSTSTSTSPRNSTALPTPESSGARNGDSSGFSETIQTAKETKPSTRPPDPENLSAGIGAVKGTSVSLSRKPTNISSISAAVTPPVIAAKNVTAPVSVPASTNQTNSSSPAPATATSQTIPGTTVAKNVTAPASVPMVSNTNETVSGSPVSGGGVAAKAATEEEMVRQLVNCDLYYGDWVRDESYPVYYKPGSCNLIDEQFDCVGNGRPDTDFQKLKWKPKGCDLHRLNGKHMLEMLRGKRLVFVGDSLNRNMWESLICILRNSVKNPSHVYEGSGRKHFRSESWYSFVFKDYDCTVEFFASAFLVRQWEVKDKDGTKKETLRLDMVGESSDQFKDADIILFNTGHWWTHEKTSKGQDYYQEGSHVYKDLKVTEAFRRALTTWARWVDANVNPSKTFVLFRGYSASHFSGGQWNSGGQCDSETQPIRNKAYLSGYPWKMKVFESVIKGMKTQIAYLNITRMSDYRKDGHPSIYRKKNLSDEERRSPLSGGQWNSGGQCDSKTQPIRNKAYLSGYPWRMKVFESVIKGMKTQISYLNITIMSDYIKDGHPSIYRKKNLSDEDRRSPLRFQDCSHRCLPTVPD
ncbi:trichome birefringence-like protein, partial [Drosera capensis]